MRLFITETLELLFGLYHSVFNQLLPSLLHHSVATLLLLALLFELISVLLLVDPKLLRESNRVRVDLLVESRVVEQRPYAEYLPRCHIFKENVVFVLHPLLKVVLGQHTVVVSPLDLQG